jgi:hypothetical protein
MAVKIPAHEYVCVYCIYSTNEYCPEQSKTPVRRGEGHPRGLRLEGNIREILGKVVASKLLKMTSRQLSRGREVHQRF